MKRVFLSFKMDDKKQVDGIRLLAWHPNMDLEFYDESVRSPYNSQNAPYIKARIREKITRASVTVGFMGANTYQSEWVDWELRTSIEAKNRIVLMGLPNGPGRLQLPPSVTDRSWQLWDLQMLRRMIEAV